MFYGNQRHDSYSAGNQSGNTLKPVTFAWAGLWVIFASNAWPQTLAPWKGPSVDFRHGPIRVSADGRNFIHEDGAPFLFLADTGEELIHSLNRRQIDVYLENRRQKGFTVVLAAILSEIEGVRTPNANGDKPFIDEDPTQPNEAFFAHLDYILDRAAEKGIAMALMPAWGDKLAGERAENWFANGPFIINAESGRVYARWLANRYKDRPNIIWVLGGDKFPKGFEPIWRAMASGLREGDGSRHPIGFYPRGDHSSSEWFHQESWLAFNMLMSSHSRRDLDNGPMIAKDYALSPPKPCLDAMPRWEDHPVGWRASNGFFDDYDVRQAAYWAIFAGAAGHTYGANPVWQMMMTGRRGISGPRRNWDEALDFAGAWNMLNLRRLMESRPLLGAVPDQSLIEGDAGKGAEIVRGRRGAGYAMLYISNGRPVTVRLGALRAKKLRAWWFDPRTGASHAAGEFRDQGTRSFTPPGEPARGNDWVLVLDDAARKFRAPGLL